MGTAVSDPRGFSNPRSEFKSGAGTDSAAEVSVALRAISSFDAAAVIGAVGTAVTSWVAGGTVGRKKT